MTLDAPNANPKLPLREWWWRPLAFTGGLIGVFAVFYAVGYARYESPQVRSDRENLARMERRNAVVFGSSHGFNVLPEQAGLAGVNLAHGGQDVFEMVYMARAVKRAAPHLETVIFTVSYFTFALDNAAYIDRGVQSRIGRRLVMYTAFPGLGFLPGDGSAWIKGLLAPVVTRDHWKSVLWPFESTRAFPTASDLPPNPKKDRKVATPTGVVSHAKRRCAQYERLMDKMSANHPDLDKDAYRMLRDVAQDLESSGVRVVLVTPPYFETYTACFDAKRQATMRKLAKRIADETGAEYFDASREPEFSKNRTLFGNSDHMNRTGKSAFSRWLGRRLSRPTSR